MLKRVLLFIATNCLVILTISILVNVLGVHHYLGAHGINYQQLAIFCAIWGMGGAFISLLLSKFIAKMAMGVVIIHPQNATRDEHFLIDMVTRLSRQAGLRSVPEVGIYHSPEYNAFATGPTKNNALVAVSSGLLSGMTRHDIEAILGHEISHIANGDMVTLTLVQGVVNSFALFLSRLLAYAISIALSRGDDRETTLSPFTYGMLSLVFDMIFTLLGSILVATFSRWREYRADHGGARLVGPQQMIAALRKLQYAAEIQDDRAPSLAALKISQRSHWLALFSTHPPLDARIARLSNMA